jgi:hypothetical protein
VAAGSVFFQEFDTCVHNRLAVMKIRQNASKTVFDTVFHVTIFGSGTAGRHSGTEHSGVEFWTYSVSSFLLHGFGQIELLVNQLLVNQPFVDRIAHQFGGT